MAGYIGWNVKKRHSVATMKTSVELRIQSIMMEHQKSDASNSPQVITDGETGIQNLIKPIRGLQVILDRDIARLYGVETGALNRQVKRNGARFPEDFMFRLTDEEWIDLKCQNGISSWGGDRQLPYAFTEQGIAMLSSVLHSNTAIEVNIRIMRAFAALRRFIMANTQIFHRIDAVEKRQIKTDLKVDAILERLATTNPPQQGVFYDGQLWDACSLVEKLIGRARVSLLLIDNWIGPGTLDMMAKKGPGVSAVVVTSSRGNQLAHSDIEKFNAQYPTLELRISVAFHDRFLIIDDKELYLIGASLKDLGKKCFGFTKMDAREIPHLKAKASMSPTT